MRQTVFANTVILSAELDKLQTFENRLRTESLGNDLKALNFEHTRCQGKYKGKFEESYVVIVNDAQDLSTLLSLSDQYGQECLLYVNKSREAFYANIKGQREKLGYLLPVNEVDAKKSEGFTYVPSLDQYYTVKANLR